MSFPEHRETLVDSVFAELGEDATWAGVPGIVRVRRSSADDEEQIGRLGIVSRGEVLRVRKSEVPDPAVGDLVDLLDDEASPTGEQLRVSGEPQLKRNRYWEMPFTTVSA